MRVTRLSIRNFRGVREATLLLPRHGVFIGDNNTGKTTILEALDLVLGPDRLNRQPPIDEHDFYRGIYLAPKAAPGPDTPSDPEEAPPRIEIEVSIADLSPEQKARFGDYVEFWDNASNTFYAVPNPQGVDTSSIIEAIRVTFLGYYDPEEDDFEGKTFFSRSLEESDRGVPFSKKDKQLCGFLYLRTLRTGARALSLERGSLLDIILRLKEVRPRMWEDTLSTLADLPVASDPTLGISPVLESINNALKKYVPKEWGVEPHLKVSTLTREHLRKVITAFIATGDGNHAAPFYRQGTGTINMLVLAMLSQIAEGKQNVIFAMEEPETAIPPYAQKRIVHEVRKLASQALFTSHSPYVLEEFPLEETIVLSRSKTGELIRNTVALPDNVKPKRYRQEFRTRFCEGLLARRILIAEGATETTAFPAACRRLSELNPKRYSTVEALGICIVDAGGETAIPGMAKLYRGLGKATYAICDKQNDTNLSLIVEDVQLLLMHNEKGFEAMVLNGAKDAAMKRFAVSLDWPQHLKQKYSNPEDDAKAALEEYFIWGKGDGSIADFLAQCSEAEMPEWLKTACSKLKDFCMDPDLFDLVWGQPLPEVSEDAAE
ncbi:ATP-dependent nuclease [Agrobacterium sp. DKPNP3]|uniref:ATP-dependent nuclease n=1 Tax=Agrobacterium sp. DKPNP3 TaxID=3457323 RepID=UPI004043D604